MKTKIMLSKVKTSSPLNNRVMTLILDKVKHYYIINISSNLVIKEVISFNTFHQKII